MNINTRRILGAASIAIATATPMAASAQAMSDKWTFQASIYGWLPEIGGKTTFPAGTGSSINVTGEEILDSLKFTFMGTFEAHKGRWGLFTDLIYPDVGGSKSGTRDITVDGHPLPVGVSANAQSDMKSVVWTLAGTYTLAARPDVYAEVLAGARMLDIKQTLGWQFSADLDDVSRVDRTGNAEVSKTVTDGIIGVKGRFMFGDDRKWFVPYYVDIGTGQSDLTWQAVGGLGYKFGWGQVFGVWRYLDYTFKSDAKIEDVNFNGPAIGVAFNW